MPEAQSASGKSPHVHWSAGATIAPPPLLLEVELPEVELLVPAAVDPLPVDATDPLEAAAEVVPAVVPAAPVVLPTAVPVEAVLETNEAVVPD